ncbi:MAG: peroxide stress protein YaaA [Alphaproteobacteria bacterium CG11_big_fil_rev_8_21_14_0_20_44_7]|nr:MAG: peroxide stress protein YaaA [Alphaproteobacteria bacterium CG11_big_fil_rev_8_21_14_0_20_44_7]
MKIIISPSKTLDFESPAKSKNHTQPQFLDDTEILATEMRKKTSKDLQKLMSISEKLGDLNYQRFQDFSAPFTPKNAKQCIYAFKGDVYDGLDAESLSEKDIEFAQEHLRILSGFYGLLRPLDLMQAYRLEMGIKLKNPRGKNLYEFWGSKLSEELGDELVINLASNEYAKAVKPKAELVIDFKENKNGKLQTIGLFAKKARGMMARYIIQNRITSPAKIKKFSEGGYQFREDLSDDKCFCFVR